VKLLLDEMWNGTIASELRRHGHDVIAAQEPEQERYAGIPDDGVFALAQQEARTIVTDNIVDYERARLQWETTGRDHHGVIYALNPPFNRHRGDVVIGQMVRALASFLSSDDARSALPSRVHYLRPP
jgi:Domain of unknown function (DUF5615)